MTGNISSLQSLAQGGWLTWKHLRAVGSSFRKMYRRLLTRLRLMYDRGSSSCAMAEMTSKGSRSMGGRMPRSGHRGCRIAFSVDDEQFSSPRGVGHPKLTSHDGKQEARVGQTPDENLQRMKMLASILQTTRPICLALSF